MRGGVEVKEEGQHVLETSASAAENDILCGYADLYRGIDGLAAIVQQEFRLDSFCNKPFLFCGRRRNRIIDRKNFLFVSTSKGATGSGVGSA